MANPLTEKVDAAFEAWVGTRGPQKFLSLAGGERAARLLRGNLRQAFSLGYLAAHSDETFRKFVQLEADA
jgi:hypothetical protein